MKVFIPSITLACDPIVEAFISRGIPVVANSTSNHDFVQEEVLNHFGKKASIKLFNGRFKRPELSTTQYHELHHQKVCRWLEEERVTHIYPGCTLNGRTLAFYRKVANALSISIGLDSLFEHKHLYLKQARKGGASTPQQYCIVNMKQTHTADWSSISFPCIAKPTCGSGSLGVAIFTDLESLQSFFCDKHGNSHYHCYVDAQYYIIEEYLPGQVISVSGCWDGQMLDHQFIYEIQTTPPPFCAETTFIYPSTLTEDQKESLSQLNQDILSAMKTPPGAFMFDYIYSTEAKRFHLIDFSPRLNSTGGHLYDLVYGTRHHTANRAVDLFLASQQNSKIKKTPVPLALNPAVVWQYLVYPKATVESLKIHESRSHNLIHRNIKLKKDMLLKEPRIDFNIKMNGSITVRGNNRQEALTNLEAEKQNIEVKFTGIHTNGMPDINL